MWTRFMDMHSGGGSKEKWEYIYIEAPEAEAKVIFYNRFDHSPERVTCTCCGDDYSISSDESLEQLSAYDRGCRWDAASRQYVEEAGASYSPYQTIEQFQLREDILLIPASEILDSERKGELPVEYDYYYDEDEDD